MKLRVLRASAVCVFASLVGLPSLNVSADYLTAPTISVSLGAKTETRKFDKANPFNNLSIAQSLANVVDAPDASAAEFHNQRSHIWVTGTLELVFDLGDEYDLRMMHFWNYVGEAYDVDRIELEFFDAASEQVGSQTIAPALGKPGTYAPAGEEIRAEDIALSNAKNVRFVNAVLRSSNGALDFNNIGFTGKLSSTANMTGKGAAGRKIHREQGQKLYGVPANVRH